MAFSIKINKPDIGLFNPEKFIANSKKFIQPSINKIITTVQNNIKQSSPVGATARLKNSIGSELGFLRGSVFTGVDYAAVINNGRRASPVSRDADLNGWIRRSIKGRKYFAALRRTYPRITVKGAAFLLRRSMKRKARKPNPFFDRGIKRSEKTIFRQTAIMSELMKRVVNT